MKKEIPFTFILIHHIIQSLLILSLRFPTFKRRRHLHLGLIKRLIKMSFSIDKKKKSPNQFERSLMGIPQTKLPTLPTHRDSESY